MLWTVLKITQVRKTTVGSSRIWEDQQNQITSIASGSQRLSHQQKSMCELNRGPRHRCSRRGAQSPRGSPINRSRAAVPKAVALWNPIPACAALSGLHGRMCLTLERLDVLGCRNTQEGPHPLRGEQEGPWGEGLLEGMMGRGKGTANKNIKMRNR